MMIFRRYEMPSKVGTKGQVVIEKELRDRLGIEPGFIAMQRLVEDHLEIRFYPPDHEHSLRGVLSGSVERSVSSDAWDEARTEAWRRSMRQRYLDGEE
jgi:AbrB family looped-hinge helix DNA binding protein